MIALILAAALQVQAGIEPSLVTGIPSEFALKTPKPKRMGTLLLETLTPLVRKGSAVIECRVNSAGKLQSCRAVEESPVKLGVGRALARLVGTFKIVPRGKDLVISPGATIRVPVHFVGPPF